MNSKYLSEIDEALRDVLAGYNGKIPEKLYEACEYSLFPGGKRVRPYLSFLTADFVGVPHEKILPIALSVELIHNYSLVHDDLPCMDDDLVRRGKPSCHAAFGEATALLCGDSLLNMAYETLFSAVKNDADLIESARFIAECAGSLGMIGGQTEEWFCDEPTEEGTLSIAKKKTAALIRASVLPVAFLSYDNKKIAALSVYADCVGLCFQLVDDLLDEDKGEDATYFSVCGREKTLRLIEKLDATAKKALAPFGKEGETLTEFCDFLTKRVF